MSDQTYIFTRVFTPTGFQSELVTVSYVTFFPAADQTSNSIEVPVDKSATVA